MLREENIVAPNPVVALELADGWVVLDMGDAAAGIAFPFSAEFAMDAASLYYAVDVLQGMSARDIAEMQREFHARQAEEQARGGASSGADGPDKPYKVYDGVAHLNLVGAMTKRPSCMGSMFGDDVSTVKLRQLARAANADPDVKSKLVRTDSPGGEVAGSFDVGDDLAGGKPMDVFYEDMGASAALIATMGARHASANQNAVLGSVGVYTAIPESHVMRERMGTKVHVVKAGKHKAIGVAGTEVTQEQLATIQSRVDTLHGLFLQRVAKGRPNMSAKQLADVADAGVYIGKEAIKVGLIDSIGSIDDAHRQAVKSNNEGTRRVTVIKDKQLEAYLSGDAAAIAAANAEADQAVTSPPAATPPVAEGQTPPTTGSAVMHVQATDPLVAELATMGVRSVSDLRGLAQDALAGRAALVRLREKAVKLAVVAYGNMPGVQASSVASAERFLSSAPLEMVQAAIETYEADIARDGLAAPAGQQRAPRFTAPPHRVGAEAADAITPQEQPDQVSAYAESAYGDHAKNGKAAN